MQIRTLQELEWAQKNIPSAVQHYLKQVTILPDLEKYLKWLDDHEVTTTVVSQLRRHKLRAAGIHPSSACKKGVCLLKLYYECTHKIAPARQYNQKSQLTWDIGTMLHDMTQAHLKAMYEEQFNFEVPLERGHIKSHTDGLFDFVNYRFVLEIKSIKEGGNYGWEKVQSKPMEDNVRQAHFYMSLADVPFALILYVNKNGSEYKEHAVVFNPATWKDLESSIMAPVELAAYKNGPKVKATSGWHCRWCDFAHSCPEKGAVSYDSSADWS